MWLGLGVGKGSALGQGPGHIHLVPLGEGRKASALECREPGGEW